MRVHPPKLDLRQIRGLRGWCVNRNESLESAMRRLTSRVEEVAALEDMANHALEGKQVGAATKDWQSVPI